MEAGTINLAREDIQRIIASHNTRAPLSSNGYIDPRPEASMVTISQQIGAVPSGDFSWRAPSPPHIHVPQAPDDQTITLPGFSGFADSPEEAALLKIITEGDHVAGGYKEWKYEWRRKAQPILSFLYLGPAGAARDVEFLRSEGITMLLVVRDSLTAFANLMTGEKIAKQLGIQSDCIDVSGNQALIATFPRAIKVVNDHLISAHQHFSASNTPNRKGKVLLYCESGNERSAAVVAAYIMSTFNNQLIPTLQYIQSQRFCVAFDDSMKNLLASYRQILDARAAVAKTSTRLTANTNTQSTKKRGSDQMGDDGEGDVDMGGQDDKARFLGRAQFAPFHQTQ
ncbi:dual specificity phosphatase-like protein [Halenospora varia]|nr:dual specificity phosphatase-like protein [Halenospora varia]